MNLLDYGSTQLPNFTVLLILIWSMVWKGTALWRASKENQRNWFIALLLLNTVGILDFAYLFYFSKKKLTLDELKSWTKFK